MKYLMVLSVLALCACGKPAESTTTTCIIQPAPTIGSVTVTCPDGSSAVVPDGETYVCGDKHHGHSDDDHGHHD